MSNDRIIGIPPDTVVHEDQVYAANAVPTMRDLVMYEIPKLWEMGVDGSGVVVSINDTGGDENHPDIPKAIARRSFVGGDTGDRNDHGTWCIGRVLGRNGVGIAPKAELIIAKVLSDSGSGSTSGINAARVWAAKEGADILSESLGGGSPDNADIASIEEAYANGVQLDVAAAGNSGYRGGNTIGYPGRYLQTFCIGSHDLNGNISTFSSGGREIDCATPGENVISCKRGGGYQSMSGTSMATPFFAGLMALIIQRRRGIGLPDLHGADAWREFFSVAGFFQDRGEPGKDVRFGLGVPLIHKIIEWLKEPKWLSIVFALVLFSCSSAMAQTTQESSVKQANHIEADSAVVTKNGSGVSVLVEGIKGQIEAAAVITTDAKNPLVRAYEKTNPFPPKNLNPIGDGKYLLTGKPGQQFTIEILALQDGGQWWTEYLTATIGPQPPPTTNPTDPPVVTDPVRDYSEITKFVAEHDTPTQDKATASAWKTSLENAAKQFTADIDAARKLVGDARRKVFIERTTFTTNWNPLLMDLDKKIQADPPSGIDEYKSLVLAIAKGLTR